MAEGMLKGFLISPFRKCLACLHESLLQGTSPRRLTLTVSLGMVIGLIPLLWGATLLCFLVAAAFRLNHPAIQAANYVMYPLQLVLVLPFYRLGGSVFPGGPDPGAPFLASLSTTALGQDASSIFLSTLKAVAVWMLVAPPAAFILYLLLLPLIIRIVPPVSSVVYPDADSTGDIKV